MTVSARQLVVGMFDRGRRLASRLGMLGGLLCLVLTGTSLADAAANTPEARDLSIAMDELRAAHQAWQENEKEFKSLKEKGEASDVEVSEFSAFVDDLRGQVLDGCREVRALGGNPDGEGVGCQPLEEESRKAPEAPEKRETGDDAKKQADAGSEAREAANTPADEKTAAGETGEAKSTARDQGGRPEQARSAPEASGKEARQASRGEERSDPGSGRQRGTGTETRQANPSSAAAGRGDQSGAKGPPRQRSAAAPKMPARDGAQSLPQSESQAYQSQLKALEAELDGYLNTQLSKVREKATNSRQTQGQASAGYGQGEGAGASGAWGAGGGLSGAGAQPKEPGAGPGTQKEGAPPGWKLPPGVGDGSDDDVVARQLREAAQAETDPETRRRLWEEYKKYKDST